MTPRLGKVSASADATFVFPFLGGKIAQIFAQLPTLSSCMYVLRDLSPCPLLKGINAERLARNIPPSLFSPVLIWVQSPSICRGLNAKYHLTLTMNRSYGIFMAGTWKFSFLSNMLFYLCTFPTRSKQEQKKERQPSSSRCIQLSKPCWQTP